MGVPLRKQLNSHEMAEVFKTFPILGGFPEHLIELLASASQMLHLPVNTQILQQGQLNEHLYFLVEGQVGIYVDQAPVSLLKGRGDLIGEMSVISNKAVGATILAETDVSLIRVDSKVFLEMQGPERDLYLSILYRIYATVLSEKLSQTNQKAKHFEELTIKLRSTQGELELANSTLEKKVEERTQKLEQQNAELMASKNKMAELLNTKKVLFQKLTDFQSKNLFPLKSTLDELRKKFPADTVVDEARRVVFDTQQLLVPITDHYFSEQAMQSKRVLLADSNKRQQIIAKMALGGSGVELDLASTVAEGQEKLASKTYDLVFADSEMLELSETIKLNSPKARLVLMTSETIPHYMPAIKKLSAIPHIISRDETDRTFTVKNIMTTVSKLLSQDIFGVEKYLIWGVDINSRPIFSSRQRNEIISDVDATFEKLGIRRANRERIKTVLEEMLMNAIYDAPTGPDGKAIYNHLPRTQELTLKPEEQGLVRFATDGMIVAVSVQDPFGSLTGATLLKYLEHNYKGEADSLNEGQNKGGAGRGLHQIVENSDLVVFNVEPGKRTEAIALFNVEVKEAANKNPSFHLFIKS